MVKADTSSRQLCRNWKGNSESKRAKDKVEVEPENLIPDLNSDRGVSLNEDYCET